MAELCLMVFHTLGSSAVPETSGLSKLKNKCGWMDGWGQICATSRASVLWFFLSSILICRRSPFVHSRCDRPAADYGRCFPGGDASDEQAGRQTSATSVQIYYLCSCSEALTAVFTLDPGLRIRWQRPRLQPLRHPFQFFITCPLTLIIHKIK